MPTTRFDDAVLLASQWHRGQVRKGTDVPYLAHLLAVSALVLEHGGSPDEAIAGLLHDALEDAPCQDEALHRRGEIRTRFGENVLEIVDGCTDSEPHGKARERGLENGARRLAWEARKGRYLRRLAEASGSTVLVAAADKVHNARSIVRDLGEVGPSVWDRFFGGRDGTRWYYRALLEVLVARAEDEVRIRPLVRELGRSVEGMG